MPITKKKFNIEVGTSIISIFSRMQTETIQLFSEFIDNSLQSYLDHREELNKIGVNCCKIDISWSNDEIVVLDNAFGMNEEEFGNALRLNSPAKKYSSGSLSKYGIGLKYAAASFGDLYTIDSTTYGSKELYHGKIDVEELKKYNLKELFCNVDEVDEDKHFTKLTIRNLIRRHSNAEETKTVNLLGKVYEEFITNNDLKLTVNGYKVEFNEPEYRKDSKNREYLEFFDNSFEFEGKKYEYKGYIAILKKGNQDESGFQLKLNKRVLELSYKPKELLGRGNDYKQQRIYGVIEFIGENWVPRFDKDGVAWGGTGLEERFIESLKSNKQVSDMLRTAIKLRKEDNPMCKVKSNAKNASIFGIQKNYKIDEEISFNVYPYDGYKIRAVKVNGKAIDPIDASKNLYSVKAEFEEISISVLTDDDKGYTSIPKGQKINSNIPLPKIPEEKIDSESEKKSLKINVENKLKFLNDLYYPETDNCKDGYLEHDNGIFVEFKNRKFSFEIIEVDQNYDKQFINIKQKPKYKDSYIIELNLGVTLFNAINIDDDVRELVYINAIVLTLSRFISIFDGCTFENTQIMFNAINSLVNGED